MREVVYPHENLNGSGYPNRITQQDILPQTRIMTICDIYDALIANDRPYKESMSPERALDIISAQVKAGQLDANYFEIFVQARLFDPAAGFASREVLPV